jgi:hypothetical protein
MRGEPRSALVRIGQTLLVCALAGSAVTALTSGQAGWRNHWGGLVSPAIVLAIAVLLVVAVKRTSKSGKKA